MAWGSIVEYCERKKESPGLGVGMGGGLKDRGVKLESIYIVIPHRVGNLNLGNEMKERKTQV